MVCVLLLPLQIGGGPGNPLLEQSYRQFLVSLFLRYLRSLQVHPTRHLDTSKQLGAACEVMHRRT